jgi:hypothetical protein
MNTPNISSVRGTRGYRNPETHADRQTFAHRFAGDDFVRG